MTKEELLQELEYIKNFYSNSDSRYYYIIEQLLWFINDAEITESVVRLR